MTHKRPDYVSRIPIIVVPYSTIHHIKVENYEFYSNIQH